MASWTHREVTMTGYGLTLNLNIWTRRISLGQRNKAGGSPYKERLWTLKFGNAIASFCHSSGNGNDSKQSHLNFLVYYRIARFKPHWKSTVNNEELFIKCWETKEKKFIKMSIIFTSLKTFFWMGLWIWIHLWCSYGQIVNTNWSLS